MKQAMVRCATQVYVLADSSKMDNEYLVRFAAIDEVAEKTTRTSEFRALPPEQQTRIRDELAAQKASVASQTLIPALRHRATEVRSNLLADTLTRIAELTPAPAPTPAPQPQPAGGVAEAPAKPYVPPTPAKPARWTLCRNPNITALCLSLWPPIPRR